MAVEFLEGRVQQAFGRPLGFLARSLTLPRLDDRVEELIDVGAPVRILLLVPFSLSGGLGNGIRCPLSPARRVRRQEKSFYRRKKPTDRFNHCSLTSSRTTILHERYRTKTGIRLKEPQAQGPSHPSVR